MPNQYNLGLTSTKSWPTSVSADGRSILDQWGNPWLMLACQILPAMHNVTGLGDIETVFNAIQPRGFNAVWISCTPDVYIGGADTLTDWAGNAAFGGSSFASPNSAYWSNFDSVVSAAEALGITCCIMPVETGGVALSTNAVNAGNTGCNTYGQFLGNRYKGYPNVLWYHGNDFGLNSSWISGPPSQSNDTLMENVLSGIKAAGDTHLHTIELNYNLSLATDDSSSGGWRSLIDINQTYTYYKTYDITYKGWLGINSNDALTQAQRYTPKPVFLGESNYEAADNVGNGANPATPYVLRCQNYWTLLAGGLGGQVWGNKAVHHFLTSTPAPMVPGGWQENLGTEGFVEAGIWANFFRSYHNWNKLVPDVNNTFVTGGFGTYDGGTNLITAGPGSYATAAVTADGHLGMCYTPVNQGLVVAMSKMAGTTTAKWFDPTAASYTTIGTFSNSGSHTFTPPATNNAGSTDWVLVLTA